MTCAACGVWAPDDQETGFGADVLCPNCKAEGFDIDAQGNILDPESAVAVKPAVIEAVEDDDEIPF